MGRTPPSSSVAGDPSGGEDDERQPRDPVPTLSDRQWAVAAPLAALAAAALTHWFAGVAGTVAAFVVWMLVRDRSAFASEHAKEAANFNLSMFLYACAAGVIGIVLVGATVLTLGIGALVTIRRASCCCA